MLFSLEVKTALVLCFRKSFKKISRSPTNLIERISYLFKINVEWNFVIFFLLFKTFFLNGLLNKFRFQNNHNKWRGEADCGKQTQKNSIIIINKLNNSRWLPDAGLGQNFTPLIFAQLPIRLHTDRLHENSLDLLLPLLLVRLLVHQEPTHGDVLCTVWIGGLTKN